MANPFNGDERDEVTGPDTEPHIWVSYDNDYTLEDYEKSLRDRDRDIDRDTEKEQINTSKQLTKKYDGIYDDDDIEAVKQLNQKDCRSCSCVFDCGDFRVVQAIKGLLNIE